MAQYRSKNILKDHMQTETNKMNYYKKNYFFKLVYVLGHGQNGKDFTLAYGGRKEKNKPRDSS